MTAIVTAIAAPEKASAMYRRDIAVAESADLAVFALFFLICGRSRRSGGWSAGRSREKVS